MYDHNCRLLQKTITISDAGDPVETINELTSRDVFCRIESASYKDKEAAQNRGKTASLTVILADIEEYTDERFLKIGSVEYEVVDTYFNDRSKEIRLVVTEWEGQ